MNIRDTSEYYKKDGNCCTVVALMVVMGCSFEDAQWWMKHKAGRKHGRGLLRKDQDRAFSAMKNTKVVNGPYTIQNRITLNQFLKKHPVGRFYCCSRGHAFAIIDGVVYDHQNKPRRQITYAKRIYRKGEY
jgi:hypothetical protein